MDFLARLITWINVPVNAAGEFLFFFIGSMPGWLSNTIISGVVGVIILIIFKYTSNQGAIARVRDKIKANMLALRLFKDSMVVTLKSQGQVFGGAFQLLFHAIRPMLVMIVPFCLILVQMALWYQYRPLKPGEETIIIMELNDNINSPWPEVSVESTPAAEVITGPVKVLSKQEVYWKIRAGRKGYHHILFKVNQQKVEKELAIGDGFMHVSSKRPGLSWSDILKHPVEKPFGPDSVVQSISVSYPPSKGIFGIPWWMIYFFVASMVFALLFKPFLKVRI